jgi:hypothetical protein
MARGTPRRDHRRIAQRRTAFQVDGDNILGLVVVQRDQDALQQIALLRRLARLLARFRYSRRFLARWLFSGFFGANLGGLFRGFLGRGFFNGFRLYGGFLGGFASQG